ncbi:MAG TPA: aspartate kinase [Syntrophomonadaceae bacterium]|nr:aspartate kinase [Syntrophomonadaceae bacterium]
MRIVVQKYGGTSVANPELIKNVARRVVRTREEGNQVVVVVSAMGHTTDQLLELAQAITSHPPEREVDMLLATGEQVSIALMAMAINELGYPVVSFTGAQAGITTDRNHTKALIKKVDPKRVRQALEEGKIVVVAGFQGATDDDEIATLGRGGSDTTAVALAAALQADICEIYTDVDGVFTGDPRVVPTAQKLDFISYDEMLELASLGAVVLQPRSVEFAKQFSVPLHVRSSFNDHEGTRVGEVSCMEKSRLVSGVAHDLNVAKIGLFDVPDRPGIAKHIFKKLAAENINVDMIIQSWMHNGKNDIVFTVTRDDLPKALPVVEKVVKEIRASGMDYNDRVAKVSIVGAGMVTNPGVAAAMFEALADEDINIEMISTSEIKVSCVIREDQAVKAVNAIHAKFFEENKGY